MSKAERSDVARKAARRRKQSVAAEKAKTMHERRIESASRLLVRLRPRDRDLIERVLADFPTLTIRRALACLREAGSVCSDWRYRFGTAVPGAAELVRL